LHSDALGRGLISSEPESGGGEENGGEEVPCELVAARGDTTEVFELAEEALDLIALAVDRRVDGALDLTITLGGDMGPSASGSDQVEDGLGAVAAVSDERACRRQAVDELGDRRLVRCLSSGQHDPERQAVLVHQGVDLGAQSSTRTADGVIRVSPSTLAGPVTLTVVTSNASDWLSARSGGKMPFFGSVARLSRTAAS